MKVVQLGCGITGLVCAEELAKNKKVTELVLADMNIGPAEAMAKRLNNDKISVQKVDASDEKALKKLMKGTDAFISAISWMLNMKVILLAAKTNTNYVDYSMSYPYDWVTEPKKYVGETDATLLTCMGEDPGITDVFAKHSADNLDRVDRIRVMDGDSGSVEGCSFFSLWSPSDMMDEVTTKAGMFKNGEMTFAAPLSSRDIYDFPQPIGKLQVFNTDHEETFLMSGLIKGVKDVDFRIAIDDQFVNICKTMHLVGLDKKEKVDVRGVKVAPIDVLTTLMPRPTDFIGKVKGYAGIVVETTGMKGGKKQMIKMSLLLSHEKAYELSHSNATGYLVGLGGAIGTEMLLDGEIKQKGVVFPEQIPADRFLERLRAKGMKVDEQKIML
jgi:saccharopine dehydrogenase (NAD+, L-lysine-forming)